MITPPLGDLTLFIPKCRQITDYRQLPVRYSRVKLAMGARYHTVIDDIGTVNSELTLIYARNYAFGCKNHNSGFLPMIADLVSVKTMTMDR